MAYHLRGDPNIMHGCDKIISGQWAQREGLEEARVLGCVP